MNHSSRLASLALVLLVPSPGLLASVASRPAQEASSKAPAEDFSKIGTEAWLAEVRLQLQVDGVGTMKSYLQSELRRLIHFAKDRKGEPMQADWIQAVSRLETSLSREEMSKQREVNADFEVDGTSIRFTVESALTRRDRILLAQMGPSIVHVLEAILLEMEHPAQNGQYAVPPLEVLVDLDPASGMAIARVLVARPEKGWPTIVANACGGDWLRGMTSPQELVESDAYAVMIQLQGAAELSSQQRAEVLSPFLTAGVRNAEVTQAARANHDGLLSFNRFDSAATRWLQDEWLRDSDPQLRLRMAGWLVKNGAAMDQLEQMVQDANPSVRSLVPAALLGMYANSGKVTPSGSALWSRLLVDAEPRVRAAAYASISKSYRDLFKEILNDEQLKDLVSALDSPAERDLAGGLPKILGTGIQQWRRDDQHADLLAALFQSSLPDVEPNLAKLLESAMSSSIIVAGLIDRVDWTRDWGKQGESLERHSREGLFRVGEQERLRWLARWTGRSDVPSHFLEDLMRTNDTGEPIALEVLPAADAVGVLLHDRTRAGGWLRRMLLGTDWSWAQTELEAVLGEATNTPFQALLARMALASIPAVSESSRSALVADVVALKLDGMGDRGKEIGVLLARLLLEESDARRGLFIDLLAEPAEPAVPTATLHQFYDLGLDRTDVSDETMTAILDGLSERLGAVGSHPETLFVGVASDALVRMSTNPNLFREDLVREWTRSANRFSAGVRVAQAADREDMIPQMRSHLIRALTENPSSSRNWLEQVFAVKDQETLEAMVSLAYSTTSPGLRDGILARIRTRAEMMEIEAQLRPSSKGPTREDALAELVSMLENPSEVVRVEAIRSIATLGAVEYIPLLIAFLTSDSDAEKQAARIALDTLHGQAVRKE